MNPNTALSLHATAIALDGRGILLTGPSGCGKSDLALRMIHLHAATLIADDLVCLLRDGNRLFATAPTRAPPRLHVRGIGITSVPQWQADTPLALVINLEPTTAQGDVGPRLDISEPMLDLRLPRVQMNPWEISAPIKLILALERWGH